jgi:hypothetical protein
VNGNKVWTKAEILDKIENNQQWLERAILAIYARQTADEQNLAETRYFNQVGFSAADARYFTYVAGWLKSGRSLSGHYVEKSRKRIKKYWRQLVEIANSRN